MNQLVFKNNNQAVTSSLSVSENFNKGHNHVLRDVRNLQKDVSNFGQMFYETTEPDSYGRPRKIYLMNRDGFAILAMGFTGSRAMEFKMKYINEFNRMEQFLNSPEMIVQRAMEIQQKKILQLEGKLKRDEPYTTFGKAVSNSNASINIGSFSRLLYDKHGINIGRNKLFAWLRDNGYLIKSGRERNQPKQRYLEQCLFETTVTLISRSSGDVESVTTMITGKGQIEIAKRLLQEFNVREVI